MCLSTQTLATIGDSSEEEQPSSPLIDNTCSSQKDDDAKFEVFCTNMEESHVHFMKKFGSENHFQPQADSYTVPRLIEFCETFFKHDFALEKVKESTVSVIHIASQFLDGMEKDCDIVQMISYLEAILQTFDEDGSIQENTLQTQIANLTPSIMNIFFVPDNTLYENIEFKTAIHSFLSGFCDNWTTKTCHDDAYKQSVKKLLQFVKSNEKLPFENSSFFIAFHRLPSDTNSWLIYYYILVWLSLNSDHSIESVSTIVFEFAMTFMKLLGTLYLLLK